MSTALTVTLLKSGNRLVVHPTTPGVRALLEPRLTFLAKEFLFGKERKVRKGARIETVEYNCYGFDHKDRLATSLGFYDKIKWVLRDRGYNVAFKDLTPPADTGVFEPQWDRLYDPKWGITLRHRQDELLVKLFSRVSRGLPCRFDCPPGYGKSFIIGLVAMLLPRARVHVITKRIAVLAERIYPELCGMLPDVGIVCGRQKRRPDARVMCISFDSLHNSRGDADILIVDECHESAADKAAGQIGQKYEHSINVGFSATHDMRLDNKDMRTEAMFGPIVMKVGYDEAVDAGMVSPIEVHWSDVHMDSDPCEGEDDSVERKRRGVWRNDVRNEIIAANAKGDREAGLQNLITCETIEHLLALKALLPEWEVVYAVNGIKPEDARYYRQQGLWPDAMPEMTQERLTMLTKMFERGKLLNVIVTSVWNVGVSFNQLAVLNRADAGGSPIMDTQIPGRVSRLHVDKAVGIVRDYKDQFNTGFKQKATGRRRNYEMHGWTQVMPGVAKDTKPQHMLWEDD